MSNNDKNGKTTSNRIFDKATKKWYEVTSEEYAEYSRMTNTLRKRMMYSGRCCCTKKQAWLCDGCCSDCEFEIIRTCSLEVPVRGDDGEEVDFYGVFNEPETPFEDLMIEAIHFGRLLERLHQLVPQARQVGELRRIGLSDEKIAEITGIKRTTLNSRIKKAREILKSEFGEDFTL